MSRMRSCALNLFVILNIHSLSSANYTELVKKLTMLDEFLSDKNKVKNFYITQIGDFYSFGLIENSVTINSLPSMLQNEEIKPEQTAIIRQRITRIKTKINKARNLLDFNNKNIPKHILDKISIYSKMQSPIDISPEQELIKLLSELNNETLPILFISVTTEVYLPEQINLVTIKDSSTHVYEEYYFNSYLAKTRTFGKKLKNKHSRLIDRFDCKDESQFPHLHFKSNNYALNFVDAFFETNNLWKHPDSSLKSEHTTNDGTTNFKQLHRAHADKYLHTDIQKELLQHRYRIE